ncbi:hypothetical protein CUMW_075810 [Citrus unshiu]|nr:hypothetical protein CUMW_075810 [Citrus unshiu]
MIRGTRGYVAPEWFKNAPVSAKVDVYSFDSDEAAMADRSRLHKWLMIAMWCIREDPSKRPTMKVVLQMLEGLLEVPNPPCPSSFSIAVTGS